MNKKNIIVLGILILCLVFCVSGCKKTSSTPSASPSASNLADSNLAVSNLTNTDASAVDTIIQQNYNLAKVKALEWKPDAVLVSLSVKMPIDLATNSSDETYIFGSASDGKNWWSFSVSEKTQRYIRAIIPKEDYLGTEVQPINSSYWKSNYGKALQLAEANGGQAFRAINSNTAITATLHHTEPRNWLWWDLEYKSGDNKISFKINPNTNEIFDESGNPLTSGVSTSAATATPIPNE